MVWLTNPYRFGAPPIAAISDTWEWIFLGNDADGMQIDFISMAATPGGANLLTGGTASSSSLNGKPAMLAPSNGFDAINGTTANSNMTSGLRLRYVTPSPISPVEFSITNYSNNGSQAPKIIVLRALIGGQWVLFGWHFLTWVNAGVTTHTVAVPAVGQIDFSRARVRAWRFRVDTVQSDVITRIRKMEMANSSGGANIVTAGLAFVDSYVGAGGINQIVAGATNDRWASSSAQTFPNWCGLAFLSDTPAPYEFRITSNQTASDPLAPKSGGIDWTADGVTWTQTDAYSALAAWGASETRTFTISP